MGSENTQTLIYGSCGILTLYLSDPLTSLITTFCHPSVHAIGYYYLSGNSYHVSVFNFFDTNFVPWLKFGATLDMLLSSPFVQHLTIYPLPSVPLTHFSALCIQIADSFPKPQTISSYTELLLQSLNKSSKNCYIGQNGYTIVNTILTSLLTGDINICDTNQAIIINPLLSPAITIHSTLQHDQNQVDYIVSQTEQEISILSATFIELFTSDTNFRQTVITKRPNFESLNNVVTEIESGLAAGVISLTQLNDLLAPYGMNIDPKLYSGKSVMIVDGPVWCSFTNDTTMIEDLGQHIKNMYQTDSKTISDSNVIQLLTLFNTIADSHKLNTIKYKLEPKPFITNIYGTEIDQLDNNRLHQLLHKVEDLRQTTKTINYVPLQNRITREMASRHISL